MSVRTRILAAGCATALIALSGCATQMNRIEADVQHNADELALLRAEQQRLTQELAAINSLLTSDQENGNESNAQRLAKMSQLTTRLDRVIQMLEDNAEFTRRLSARVDLLADRAGLPDPGAAAPAARGGEEVEPLPEEGRAIYQAAQLDRSRGNNELARDGLREFLEKYGSSELADDALYLLGDLAYSEKHYEEALGHFRTLMTRFPRSDRLPAALLKAAICEHELGRDREARLDLERIRNDFPDSDEAELARQRLAEWERE